MKRVVSRPKARRMQPTRWLVPFVSTCILSASIVTTAGTNQSDFSSRDKSVQTVDFCDLVSQPEKYAQKIVRTKATYTENFEGIGLSKKDCPPGRNIRDNSFGRAGVADVEFDCFVFSKTQAVGCLLMKQKLRQNLVGNPVDGDSAEVVLVGWVEPLFPGRNRVGFNDAPVSFHIQKVESSTEVVDSGNNVECLQIKP
jgi:hypothetical protein